MRNWFYDAPTDEFATRNRRVVYTEAMIIAEYPSLPARGCICPMCTRAHIIADWITVYWASPTDMPVGEYITTRRLS